MSCFVFLCYEGTKTVLGDEAIKAVIKGNVDTKVLALSGTPVNIFNDYEQTEIYTWDYVMEQKAKDEWPLLHFGDSNSYEDMRCSTRAEASEGAGTPTSGRSSSPTRTPCRASR